MKTYLVTVYATVRQVVPVQANNADEAMDLVAGEPLEFDLDFGDWEALDINIEDAEEHIEED